MAEQKMTTILPNESQKKAIEFDNGNAIITASAGSGKTRVMIERAIRLIQEKKATVREILAVTFTESAAEEMKERLKIAISKKVSDGDTTIADQVNEVAMADVCTIDSFCARLIREYFFVAGVAPDFKVLDESEASAIKSDCLDDLISKLYEQKEEWFISLTNRYKLNRKDKRLKEIICSIYNFVNSEANPIELLNKYSHVYTPSNLDKVEKEYKKFIDEEINELFSNGKEIALYQQCKDLGYESGIKIVEEIKNVKEDILNNDLYVLRKYKDFKFTRITSRKEVYSEVNKEISKLKSDFSEIIDEHSEDILTREEELKRFVILYNQNESLSKITQMFMETYEKRKLEENSLDFSDLEHYALKIIANEQVRENIKSKYKYVFVDEYQDVNGVQKELITSVSNNNLFMVGDPKQSIYRFRGSDSDAFNEMVKRIEENGDTVIELNKNYRSAKAIIDIVNQVFCYSMTKEYCGIDYSKSMLEGGGIYPDEYQGRFALHAFEEEEKEKKEKIEKKPKVYDILADLENDEEEENKVHALVAKIINEEIGKPYYDIKEKKERLITYRDIVILSRAINNGDIESLVEDLKRHEIPLATSVSVNVLEYPEVDLLVNVLRLIDCFNNDIPLYITLKSAIGNFTDEELYTISRNYNDNVHLEDGEKVFFYQAFLYAKDNICSPLKEKINAFYSYYENIRFLADFLGAKKTLEKVIEDSNYNAFILADKLGEIKLDRVNFLLNLADFGGKKRSVREYIKFIENNYDSFKKEELCQENSVTLMTIHKSKGKEYPVIILYGADKKRNITDEYGEFLEDREYGIATKYYDDENKIVDETLFRHLVKKRIEREGQREAQRLLYVALTRAEYSLHVICEKDNRKGIIDRDTFIGSFPMTIKPILYKKEDLPFFNKKVNSKTVLVGHGDKEKEREIEKNISFSYPFEKETRLPLKSTVTGSINHQVDGEEYPVYRLNDDAITSKESGTIAHKILENYNFEMGDIFAQASNLVSQNIITEEELKSVDLYKINTALQSKELQEIIGKEKYREKSFVMAIPSKMILENGTEEKVLLQGVIDLLVIDDDKALIIDYKYSKSNATSLKQRYSKQLDLYSYAVEKILGKKVERKTLVNIFTGETISFE